MSANTKGEVLELLRNKAFSGLPALVGKRPAALRKLFSLLYDGEPLIQWRAVLGFGVLAREVPEVARRTLSRLAYSLNDEASVCAWMAAPALGEMTAENPGLTREVVRIGLHYLNDVETCHNRDNRNIRILSSALWAAGRMAAARPELVAELIPTIAGFTADPEPEVRAHAWWVLGRARGLPEAGGDRLAVALQDSTEATLFQPEGAEFITKRVGLFVEEALAYTKREVGK